MALDANLYSLNVVAHSVEGRIDFAEANKPPIYTARRSKHEPNDIVLVEESVQVVLARANLLKPRLTLLSLENPPLSLELASASAFTWERSFTFEDQHFLWKRDGRLSGNATDYTLFIRRRPDPDFNLVLYRVPTERKTGLLQFLDYNLQRVELKDRAGFDYLVLASVSSFAEVLTTHDDPRIGGGSEPSNAGGKGKSKETVDFQVVSPNEPRTSRRDPPSESPPNEINIVETLSDEFLTEHCLELLKDPDMGFIILKAASTNASLKAVKIAAAIKTKRLKDNNEQLHQYVIDGSASKAKSKPKSFEAASALTLYLSRFEMDELAPTASRDASVRMKLPPKVQPR